ncbi:MFS transporter [Mesorhizobium sp. ES1-1]|uniref:MFS transporter n=1 Tax=Mesorhizobium sp. ES1-1 TaxID=2876629 RepID=UPI001CCB028A|nr:MFS transporter [Mesorhizobium sp. ES1-1]MBZ9674175.1 MFS transporter [Mesorhizobium sp. ES1-1]
MQNPYAEIFRPPGAKGFALAGFVARLPIAMAPIGIVAMLSQTRGEYWLAGAVSATFALGNAFVSPQTSRLVDRLGQTRVAVPANLITVIAFAVLIVATNQDWPAWTLFVAALGAAVMPSMPAMVRARWTELFRGRPQMNTAFAFESVADELVYIVGASLSVGLSAALFPEAGVLASTLFLAIGWTAFILQRSTEPKVRPVGRSSAGSAISLRPVQIITFAMAFVGATFATTEVGTIALTKAFGQPGAASLVIGVYALGSFLLGIVVGALNPKAPLQRQLAIALAVLALGALLPLTAGSVPLLALTVFLSGVAISPTFITAFGLIERHVPEALLTEGITWVTTGIGIGMALGAFVAGAVVDAFGAQSGFWVSVASGAMALATVLLGQRSLAMRECDLDGCEATVIPAE